MTAGTNWDRPVMPPGTVAPAVEPATPSAAPPPKRRLVLRRPKVPTPAPPASRWYLVPMLLLVAVAAGTVGFEFSRQPIPPGVDPGHWLAIAYSYVGVPTAPDPTDRPFFYAPMLFPILGGFVLLTGDPLVAAGATALLLFTGYGFSVVHIARRYIAFGPLQVTLVGLIAFSGTTIQMVFWGGYPNLLGFILMNEALVFLLAFVRSSNGWYGAAFFAFVGLCYFSHDLSFAVLVASVITIAIFLLLTRQIGWKFLFHRVNLAGVVLLGAAIEGYALLTKHLGISHPSYFHSNPAAYAIDEVGEIFAPLARSPAFLPRGTQVYLPPIPTAILLAIAPLVALVALVIVRRLLPLRVDPPLVMAAGWLAAALAVPGIGYLAKVETDYNRFMYFFPLPFAILVLLSVERAMLGRQARIAAEAQRDPTLAAERAMRSSVLIRGRRRSRAWVATHLAVAFVLTIVFLTVAAPVAIANEKAGTAVAHDAAFVQAMGWLKAAPDPGSVLTTPSAARWTEALAIRDAFCVGPVWLLFDPFQIASAHATYWAIVSQYVVTNNHVALSFSGFATPVFSQAPMYSAYVLGIPFPVLRVLPGSFSVNATDSTGTHSYPLYGVTPPTLAPPDGYNDSVTYSSPGASMVERVSALPDGSAEIVFTITPAPLTSIHSFDLTLAAPPSDSTTIATNTFTGTQFSDRTMTWWVTGKVGQSPDRANVTTTVEFSATPTYTPEPVATGPKTFGFSFPDLNGAEPFVLTMHLASPGADNPSREMPPSLTSADFLHNNQIHYLLWPTTTAGKVEIAYYEATFGFRPVFANSEWTILEG